MSTQDAEYYQRRAEEEIVLAQTADHAGAVQAHYELASAYLDRIHGDSPKADPNHSTPETPHKRRRPQPGPPRASAV